MTFRFLIVLIVYWAFVAPVNSQVPGDILPMHSSCNDVSRLLELVTCEKSHEVYDLKDEKIFVDYTTELCQRAYGIEWDVPRGTVLSVIRIPKISLLLSSLSIDLSKCDVSPGMTDVKNTITYSCEALGVSISARKNYIYQIMYVPTSEDFDLQGKKRCSPK